MVVGFFGALLAVWLVVLSVRVIALRGNPAFGWFAFANFGDDSLQRAIRGQANLTEYAPIFLILMMIAEISDMRPESLYWYGGVFLAGRIMHGICFGFLRKNIALRVSGTVLTLFPLLGLAIAVLSGYL